MSIQNSSVKNTIFSQKTTMNCRGKLINFDKPLVMGILNITEDSFYDGGKYTIEKTWLNQTEKMLADGADIIDIGAASTRPGAKIVSESNEMQIILRVLNSVRSKFPDCLISIDTYHSNVAKAAVENGADIINDISGGEFDDKMFEIIAKENVPYILMHIQGKPENMQLNPHYENIIQDMVLYFAKKTDTLKLSGVNDVIIDPGFGFGKTIEDNYKVMKQLDFFNLFGLPVLVGISRKSMISRLLNISAKDALNGSSILNTIALMKGAKILRVHDIKEAVEAVKIVNMIN